MNWTLAGIAAYILAQLIIGMLVTRRIATEDDYLLAGRNLGPGLGTFTIFATWFGAETCIGAAGSVYSSGLSGGSSDPFGYALCLFLMGALFAVPLWHRGLTTLADLIRQRYSAGMERIVVLLAAPGSIIWAGAQIRAFGQVIAASSEFDVELAISAAAIVVITYTAYGGMYADVVTDLIQGVALILGLGLLLYAVADAHGGLAALLEPVDPARWNLFSGDGSWLQTLESWAVPVTGSLFAQEVIARVLASRSPRVARGACLLGGILYLAVGLIPVILGLSGVHLIPGMTHPEQLLPTLAQQHLPGILYVLFAGALISAILSTVDSALLAASALVSHNLILPLWGHRLPESAKIRIARYCVAVFGVIAYLLALSADSVHDMAEQASGFGGAGLFVAILFALLPPLGSAKAAGAALSTGIGSWILGNLWEWRTPYIVSLGSAATAFLLTGWWESRGAGGLESLPVEQQEEA